MPIRRPTTAAASASRALLATIAASVLLSACHEVAAPDETGMQAVGVTPEGVVVAARISRLYFSAGDTVRATVVLRNPGDRAVTLKAAMLQLHDASSPEAGVCARWVGPHRRFLTDDGLCSGYVADVAADLLVPARDSLTYEFALVGDDEMEEGKYTFWGEVGLQRAASDSLLFVDSNPVSAMLSR